MQDISECSVKKLNFDRAEQKQEILNMFGVVFPNRSFPMDISTFAQIDTFHWVLDMNTFVGNINPKLKTPPLFLTPPHITLQFH